MGKKVSFLAFDLGASSGRAVLGRYDDGTILFEEVHRFANEPVWMGSYFYWDFLRLWHEIKTGLRKALALEDEISGIGVDTWGVDYGLVDRRGQLLSNPRHYRDQRTVPVMKDYVGRMGADFLYGRSGVQMISFNTLFQLGDDLRNQPHILEQADQILLTPDLVNFFLTGVKAAEFSIASTTGMMNISTREWDADILKAIGLAPEKLPPIIPSGTRLGMLTPEICRELNCKPIPVIAVTGHDTAAAVLAAPLEHENSGFISSGTWSLMGVERSEPIVSRESRELDFTNEGGFGGAVLFFKNINALWFIQECRRIWRFTRPGLEFGEISQAASETRPFGPLVNISDQRFFAPSDMVNEIRAYCRGTGQPVPESVGEISRTVYESLALEYRSVSEKLAVLTRKSLQGLHIFGGGSQDQFLTQLTANVLQLPVTAGPVEATALGNIMVQAISVGAVKDIAEARQVIRRSCAVGEFRPESAEGWDEAYQRYQLLISK